MVIYVINMIFLRASFECRGSLPKKILGVVGWEVIILGDPGADSGGEGKSKRAEK